MPPLTLTILASVLHMQGADAAITSDNKGIDELLAPIREKLQQQQADPSEPRIIVATKNYTKEVHSRGLYQRGAYTKSNISASPAVKPTGGTAEKPAGGGGSHR